VDEVLLFDAKGLLVEGSRSNLLWVTREGRLYGPPLSLGAVEGLGLQVLREAGHEIGEANAQHEDLLEAREILAVNAVRGVMPIVELDGRPVGHGRVGTTAHVLNSAFGLT